MHIPLLVTDFLRRPAQLYPDKTAVVDKKNRYSYREFQTRVHKLAHILQRLGVRQGDRVGILSPNSHFFLESFYGTSHLGAVLVPINYRLTPPECEYIVNHSGAEVMLVDPEYMALLDSIRPRLPALRYAVAAQDEPHTPATGWMDWETLLRDVPSTPPLQPEIDENDLVSINYTSGTTARPKGVMLTHRNCYINAYNLIAHLGIRHEDVELWTLPMFHCNGWGGVYALTGMGGTHVILRKVEAHEIFRLIAEEGVTFACMAPAVLRIILEYASRNRHPLRTRPRFTIAGAPPPETFIRTLEETLGWEFIQIYGLTETAPLLTVSKPEYGTARDDYARRARAGGPGMGVEIAVLDGEGMPVPKDDITIGEVCTRSNVVFKGYWQQQEETDKVISGGYFHTGDLAVWDHTGNIHLVDRKKDVIISGGENVSSPEIEDILYKHPAVAEVAVIGVPDEKWGETPKAIVVVRDDTPATESELLAFCRDRLAHFKCPTSVEFVDSLPRTATGKLQKFKLREKYWKGSTRRIH